MNEPIAPLHSDTLLDFSCSCGTLRNYAERAPDGRLFRRSTNFLR